MAVPPDIVVLGKIVGAYGLRGAVKIHPFADDPAGWVRLPRWWLGHDEHLPESWVQATLRRGRLHSETVVAELDCAADRDAAEALKGTLVGVPRSELPKTAKDEFYWADLIGLNVVNQQDQLLGRVLGLIEASANDVLRVGDGEGGERLLPFVGTVVLDVDLAVQQIRVAWELDW